jgi:hypothetical protein
MISNSEFLLIIDAVNEQHCGYRAGCYGEATEVMRPSVRSIYGCIKPRLGSNLGICSGFHLIISCNF